MSGALNLFAWMRAIHADKALTLADKVVASNLATYVDRSTGECFPMMATIAENVGVSERSVRRAMSALEAGGWLNRQRSNRRQSYTYIVVQKGAPVEREASCEPASKSEDAMSRPDTDVRSANVRPDTGVLFDRTRVSADPSKDPKKPPYPLSQRSTPSEGQGLSERVVVAVDDPRWVACASAYRRKRGVGPPTTTITVNGRRVLGWFFDRSLVELAAVPPGYRYPYAEAAE